MIKIQFGLGVLVMVSGGHHFKQPTDSSPLSLTPLAWFRASSSSSSLVSSPRGLTVRANADHADVIGIVGTFKIAHPDVYTLAE
jgi:hypothetical protein